MKTARSYAISLATISFVVLFLTGCPPFDYMPPAAPIVTGTTLANGTTPTWSWSSSGGGNGTFSYQLNSETGEWTVTIATTYTPDFALPAGTHTLYVQECDSAGNWSLSGSFSVVLSINEYNIGYEDGFYTDSKYWEGYDDSYLTEPPDGPILYRGSEIPALDDGSYEAGYYDGLWQAYNDGYFVSYDYGFTIGFSEGYDIGYHPDWYAFLINDAHSEYYDGSFMDGYQDGFSEGSVFGAVDYKIGLPFDWEDAMWDYRSGTDVFIDEVGFGSGEIYLYECGIDPNAYYAKTESVRPKTRSGSVRLPREGAAASSPRASVASVMKQLEKAEGTEGQVSYRALTDAARTDLDIRPEYSPRFSERSLKLTDTWLQRIERYRASLTQ